MSAPRSMNLRGLCALKTTDDARCQMMSANHNKAFHANVVSKQPCCILIGPKEENFLLRMHVPTVQVVLFWLHAIQQCVDIVDEAGALKLKASRPQLHTKRGNYKRTDS